MNENVDRDTCGRLRAELFKRCEENACQMGTIDGKLDGIRDSIDRLGVTFENQSRRIGSLEQSHAVLRESHAHVDKLAEQNVVAVKELSRQQAQRHGSEVTIIWALSTGMTAIGLIATLVWLGIKISSLQNGGP